MSAQITGAETAFEISTTDWKSPGLEIGNPASIISTPVSQAPEQLRFSQSYLADTLALVHRPEVLCQI